MRRQYDGKFDPESLATPPRVPLLGESEGREGIIRVTTDVNELKENRND